MELHGKKRLEPVNSVYSCQNGFAVKGEASWAGVFTVHCLKSGSSDVAKNKP